VVQDLSREGLVDSVRGRGGGVELACEPARVRIGALVRRLEGGGGVVECVSDAAPTCPLTPVCILQDALRDATEAFFQRLDGYTLADLVENRAPLLRALGRPAAQGGEPC
jgi:Rrf2 family transcriptional regulator, nitric oxide-sensitive transcriptional repressor